MKAVEYKRSEGKGIENVLSELAKLLRKSRDVSGCGLPEFAKKIGISTMRLARFENGLDDVSVEILVKAYKATGLPKDNIRKYLGEFRSEQEKLDWFLERVKGCMHVYCPPFQREAILFFTEGRKPAENPSGEINYLIEEKLKKTFAGCEASFRNEVLSAYLNDVLPPLQAEYDNEVAVQDATNDLLALTNGKTVGQIRTMIQVLKINSTGRKKYKKCS